MVTLSAFGEKLSSGAGILSLMDDLGNALAEGGKIMMGGGNPGHIPLIQERMAQRLRDLTDDDESLRRLIGVYDPPRGDREFLQALAELLRQEYGWQLSEENICLTNGSQSAFFLLFNLLAGMTADGGRRRILLPMAPEYIGYADLGLASEHGIPFIIDTAYGLPFPGMIYTEATPIWNEGIVLCLSLSKFGLPAVRTGIVIADKELIRVVSGANAVVNLAPGSFGAMLTTEIVRTGEILRLSQDVIRPFYQHKMERALACVHERFAGLPYKVHVPEGAMFLWMWFPGLPISVRHLYQRLKERGVIVVAGDYFFPGLPPGWRHAEECLRITYSQDEEDVQRGIAIIAEELQKLYA